MGCLNEQSEEDGVALTSDEALLPGASAVGSSTAAPGAVGTSSASGTLALGAKNSSQEQLRTLIENDQDRAVMILKRWSQAEAA